MKKSKRPVFEDNKPSTIECPNCQHGVLLIVKTNQRNGGQFLGCPNWPDCTQAREIPEAWYMEAMGQPMLF